MEAIEKYIKGLQKRFDRLMSQLSEMEKEHSGKEQNYTYHGGFSLGYLKGKISEIEEIYFALTGEELTLNQST